MNRQHITFIRNATGESGWRAWRPSASVGHGRHLAAVGLVGILMLGGKLASAETVEVRGCLSGYHMWETDSDWGCTSMWEFGDGGGGGGGGDPNDPPGGEGGGGGGGSPASDPGTAADAKAVADEKYLCDISGGEWGWRQFDAKNSAWQCTNTVQPWHGRKGYRSRLYIDTKGALIRHCMSPLDNEAYHCGRRYPHGHRRTNEY
jgi:hypothetical protein